MCIIVFSMGCRTSQTVRRAPQDDIQPTPAPSVSQLSIRGYLAYRSGARGKRFYWNLRFFEESGIVMGSSRDRDGYAEFFGTYNPRTQRFRMVKHFKYRRRGKRVFFYRGLIRNGRLIGTAHLRSYLGPRYAGWAGSVSFTRLKYTQGRPKRFMLRGRLRYRSGSSKVFLWKLHYFRSSGACYGRVSDRDGIASFSGVYDRQTNRFFLRKRYRNGRTFFYVGRMTRGGAYGNARRYSFTSRHVYASWRAGVVWRR